MFVGLLVLPRSACVYAVVIGAPTNQCHKPDKRKNESNIKNDFSLRSLSAQIRWSEGG